MWTCVFLDQILKLASSVHFTGPQPGGEMKTFLSSLTFVQKLLSNWKERVITKLFLRKLCDLDVSQIILLLLLLQACGSDFCCISTYVAV